MAKYIDQAIFDSGLLILGQYGVLEKMRLKEKFDIVEFAGFQNLLQTYKNVRPDDNLYISQTVEALGWVLAAIPIGMGEEEYSTLLAQVLAIRIELNADMKAPKLTERIFRGGIFQAEEANYLNRVEQSKINTAELCQKISPIFKRTYNSIDLLKQRMRPPLIAAFIDRNVVLTRPIFKKKDAATFSWNANFHLICTFATLCYWSTIKRISNVPNHTSPLGKDVIYNCIEQAVTNLASGNMDVALAAQILDIYITDFNDHYDVCEKMTEADIWDSFYYDSDAVMMVGLYCKSTPLDDDVIDFIQAAEPEFRNTVFVDILDGIDIIEVGRDFLG